MVSSGLKFPRFVVAANNLIRILVSAWTFVSFRVSGW